jgi:hypothetical protein
MHPLYLNRTGILLYDLRPVTEERDNGEKCGKVLRPG